MKYLILKCLVLMIWGCHIAAGPQSIAVNPQQSVVATGTFDFLGSGDLRGLYVGTSDNQLGHRAWLLTLDVKANRGTLYIPPNNLELSDVALSPVGQVRFQSAAGLGNVVYSFSGHTSSQGIDGVFHIMRDRAAGIELASASVSLRELGPQHLYEGPFAGVAGLYSNVEYNEEAGDLTGEALVLIPDGQRLMGIFTSYDNEMLPYAADITLVDDRIRFKIRTESGEESYQGTLSRKRITLWQDDPSAELQAKAMVLERR